jgi:hypothetical protein
MRQTPAKFRGEGRRFVIKLGTSPQRAENPITWSHAEIDVKRLDPLTEES